MAVSQNRTLNPAPFDSPIGDALAGLDVLAGWRKGRDGFECSLDE